MLPHILIVPGLLHKLLNGYHKILYNVIAFNAFIWPWTVLHFMSIKLIIYIAQTELYVNSEEQSLPSDLPGETPHYEEF